jgi:hypothetical protein
MGGHSTDETSFAATGTGAANSHFVRNSVIASIFANVRYQWKLPFKREFSERRLAMTAYRDESVI